MLQAVLFDLDDTLLGNNIDAFIPHYFALLSKYAERYMPRDRFLQELMIATQAMATNVNTAVLNRDAFWNSFHQRTGLDADEMEAYFDIFYQQQFPQLAAVVQPQPVARPTIQTSFDRGLKVVIATNPMFPRRAVEERLAWAGVPVTDFAYDLVTTYDNMHATKPHLAYYQEVLDAIGVSPEASLMVGDDWENDIAPAAALGCQTYWISNTAPPQAANGLVGYGSLAAFYALLASGALAETGATAVR
jgi:FMN phosphatase YigB (HAD superfamily)